MEKFLLKEKIKSLEESNKFLYKRKKIKKTA